MGFGPSITKVKVFRSAKLDDDLDPVDAPKLLPQQRPTIPFTSRL